MLVSTSNTTFAITRLHDKLGHKTRVTSIKRKEKKRKKVMNLYKFIISLPTSNDQVATTVSVICCILIIFRCLMYRN